MNGIRWGTLLLLAGGGGNALFGCGGSVTGPSGTDAGGAESSGGSAAGGHVTGSGAMSSSGAPGAGGGKSDGPGGTVGAGGAIIRVALSARAPHRAAGPLRAAPAARPTQVTRESARPHRLSAPVTSCRCVTLRANGRACPSAPVKLRSALTERASLARLGKSAASATASLFVKRGLTRGAPSPHA